MRRLTTPVHVIMIRLGHLRIRPFPSRRLRGKFPPMHVIKRNGQRVEVRFDKILDRINVKDVTIYFCNDLLYLLALSL
jgi:hypothetical protein